MKKNRLLKLLLVGGLMITSAAISLSSCKKENNEANDEPNLPTVENIVRAGDEARPFRCPYCKKFIPIGGNHLHHFSPRQGENTLPSNWQELNLTWGSMDSLDVYGNIVYDTDGITPLRQRMGNRAKPFTVDYCETYWNLDPGDHVCGYCVDKIYHRHKISYNAGTGPAWGHTQNDWHVGGGTLEP